MTNEVVPGTGQSNGELRAYVERIESVEADIKDRNEDKSEIYKELKSAGFDAPTVKTIIALRRKDPAKRQEQEALLDLYKAELGIDP